MNEVFGMKLTYVMNSRIAWKQYILGLFITYLITSPFAEVFVDYLTCMQSITEIEE